MAAPVKVFPYKVEVALDEQDMKYVRLLMTLTGSSKSAVVRLAARDTFRRLAEAPVPERFLAEAQKEGIA
jgi:hypothetical protein